jgi:hypothetical protein
MTFKSSKEWYGPIDIYSKFTGNVRIQETLTADSIEGFLRSKNMGVLVENGGICSSISVQHEGELNSSSTGAVLQDDEDFSVPDDAKAIFHAQAGLSV